MLPGTLAARIGQQAGAVPINRDNAAGDARAGSSGIKLD